jgi:hypothetical protein
MKHFGIVPILTYGLEMLWEHLSEKFLNTLQNVQVTHKYESKAVRISRFTPWRLVCALARRIHVTEDFLFKLLLSYTNAASKLITERRKKEKEL